MKRQIIFSMAILTFALASVTAIAAQVRPPLPRGSQKATVMQTIGTTEVSITYSRPAVKGRLVYGDWPTKVEGEATLDDGRARPAGAPLVPYGHIWRAGANEATLFVATDDVVVNGAPLAAGKYSLHMLPGKDDWTIIFNKDDGQWGSFSYDAKKDALRVKAIPQELDESQELLLYRIEAKSETTATVSLRWERIRVPFTVEVKDVVGSTMVRLRAYVAGAKSDDPGPAFNAANYAKTNKQMDDATKWFDMAAKASDELVKAKPTFASYRQRSNIFFAAGRLPESLAAAEKAVELGKAEKADTAALEKRIADIKAGKQ